MSQGTSSNPDGRKPPCLEESIPARFSLQLKMINGEHIMCFREQKYIKLLLLTNNNMLKKSILHIYFFTVQENLKTSTHHKYDMCNDGAGEIFRLRAMTFLHTNVTENPKHQ